MITKFVYKALIKEVELTPKPGLVDKNNNGSHKDMNLETFYKSAEVIKPFIKQFLDCKSSFKALREVGLECEEAMFKATNGVNTHKGMIFSLAIICGAIGAVGYTSREKLQSTIRFICKDVVKKDLDSLIFAKTHGEKFYQKTNSKGIRGEAELGYPSVFKRSLPYYKARVLLYGEDKALKMTLLYLMSFVEDSTIYARGGKEGLKFVQQESKKLLHVKVDELDSKLEEFDKVMIEKNLSAGGSADLLALTLFLANFNMV